MKPDPIQGEHITLDIIIYLASLQKSKYAIFNNFNEY